jgi:2-oxoglutarate ferredoxin oxidoreductase subunit alpha
MRAEGYSVSNVHLRWLNPLHPKLGELLKRFKRIVVPEMNLGQLVKVIRSEYVLDAESMTKVQGKPFKVSEICDKIRERAGKTA